MTTGYRKCRKSIKRPTLQHSYQLEAETEETERPALVKRTESSSAEQFSEPTLVLRKRNEKKGKIHLF